MAISIDLKQFNYKNADNNEKKTLKREIHEAVTAEEDFHDSKKRNWPGPLPPILTTDLKIVFVGFNPGVESGRRGHYYAHHSNRFWKYLFWSGFSSSLHIPEDDAKMPELYHVGFTDIVARCTKGIQQLSKEELLEGSVSLEERIAEFKPKFVCLVGRGIWEAIAKARGWNIREFKYGVDPYHKFGGSSTLCCVPSTSGLNSMSAEKQLGFWKEVYAAANEEEEEAQEEDKQEMKEEENREITKEDVKSP